jgi:UDP-glucose 4-epimerase
MKRNFLVTGGAGFIGAAVARALVDNGDTVVVADNLSTGYRGNIPAGCRFVEMDVSNREHFQRLPDDKFDAIFHLAAQSSGEASFQDPWYDFNSHATATFLLLELCRKRGISRFLYGSSMSIYGDPQYLPVDERHPASPKTFYAAGKLAAEAYVSLHSTLGIGTTVFRMFSVYGPNQNLANKMQGMASIYLSFILENKPILVKGSRERFRDFVYIDDVVDAWLSALDKPAAFGKTYNLGTGRQTTVSDLLQTMTACAGNPDYPIEFSGNTPGDQFGMYADIGRLRADLGWEPRWSLEQGLASMLDSYKSGVRT